MGGGFGACDGRLRVDTPPAPCRGRAPSQSARPPHPARLFRFAHFVAQRRLTRLGRYAELLPQGFTSAAIAPSRGRCVEAKELRSFREAETLPVHEAHQLGIVLGQFGDRRAHVEGLLGVVGNWRRQVAETIGEARAPGACRGHGRARPCARCRRATCAPERRPQADPRCVATRRAASRRADPRHRCGRGVRSNGADPARSPRGPPKPRRSLASLRTLCRVRGSASRASGRGSHAAQRQCHQGSGASRRC